MAVTVLVINNHLPNTYTETVVYTIFEHVCGIGVWYCKPHFAEYIWNKVPLLHTSKTA